MTQTTIKPGGIGFLRYLGEIWPHRNLLVFFAVDAATAFYRNTVIGIPWLFLRPLLPAILFAFIFGKVDSLQTPGIPYILYVLSGLIILQPSNFGIRRVTRSLSSYSNFVKKRYFPRVIIPMAYCFPVALQLLAGLVLFAVATVVCIYIDDVEVNLAFSWRLLYLPLAFLLSMGLMLSLGCVLTVLNAAAHDVRMSLPMVNMGLMVLTPIFYPITLIDESVRWAFLTFNPLAVGVMTFRYAVFGAPLNFDPVYIAISSGVCLAYLAVAVFVFVRADPVLADIA